MDGLLRLVKILQIADANNVAIPANCPNNEIFGDRVIIPHARDVKTAKEKLANTGKDYQCLNWCLCYKKL